MRHLWRATRICWKPSLSAHTDEFGHTTDKQRQVSFLLVKREE